MFLFFCFFGGLGGKEIREPYYDGFATRHTPPLRGAPKSIAARFFQLSSGHAMIAPFLKERWGWTDTDICWCNSGRQSREHLFKECKTRTREIIELWTAVGKASGRRKQTDDLLKSRNGFGYGVRQAQARPSNTSVRDLLSNEQYTVAVLRFLGDTRVGEVKEELFVNKRQE